MSKWSLQVPTFQPGPVADVTLMTNSQYMAIQGVASTALNIIEVFLGGQATASNPMYMMLARDSSVAQTPTSPPAAPTSNAPLQMVAQVPGTLPLGFIAATTNPLRASSATLARLNFSFNAFGGIVRWVAAPGEEWQSYGAAVNGGESSLSNFTGGGSSVSISAHIIYEPF